LKNHTNSPNWSTVYSYPRQSTCLFCK